MKNPRFKGYIYWGVTLLAVIACSVAFVFFLLKFQMVAAAAGKLVDVLMPIIYGAVLAYLMLPVYNKTRRYVTENLSVKVKNEKMVQSAARGLGTLVSLLLLIAIVVGLCWMLLPQIYTSILGLQESFSENINNLSIWLQKQLADNEALEQMVVPVYEQVTDKLETWLYDTLVPNMSMVINILSTGLLGVVTVLKNSLIGLIVMVYFLNIKDTLSAQSKKIVYSLFPPEAGQPHHRGGPLHPQRVRRIYHREAAGLLNHRCDLLFLHAPAADALRAVSQRDHRRDQCDPVFWSLHRSHPQRLFDFAGEPYEMPVFSAVRAGAAAV